MPTRFFRQHTAVLCLSAVAVCLVVIRACVQNISIDEATSYLLYAAPGNVVMQWYPASGNHVLNSLLMRLSTVIFGINEFTVRIPAIIGALIYIFAALYLCLLITGRKLLQVALLTCLIYNPIVLDYLVAARGYSMAIGFLLAAIALIANITVSAQEDVSKIIGRCVWASAFLALSFAANFSFAIADGTTMLLFFLWLEAHQRKAGRPRSLRLATACFLPGIVVAFVICGSVILGWPKGQLYFGAQSLSEMWRGLGDATFDDPNPNIVNPLLLQWVTRIRPALPYVAALTILWLLALQEFGRFRGGLRDGLRSLLDIKDLWGSLHGDTQSDGLLSFTRLLVMIAVTTLVLHWLAFHLVQLLLPRDRTALFFVALWTLAFGGMLALRLRPTKRDLPGSFGLTVLIVTGIYFLGCVRLAPFKEWYWDADTKHVYWLLADLNRRCGITEFAVDWRYRVPLHFYRIAYRNTSLKEFPPTSSGELPTDKTAYAIFFPSSEDFIRQQHLQVIYHNDDSGSAVAIRGCPAQH